MTNAGKASRLGRVPFLTEEQKRDIYSGALEITGQVGMRVDHEGVRARLEAGGCEVEGALVRMPRHLVEKARLSAPAVVNLYDREGRLAMELGGNNSYFGTGSDLMHTFDLETGERRESCLEDVGRAARLGDALPNIDFIMSSAYPNDVNPHHSYLLSFKAMVEASSKPLVVTAENGADLRVMVEVAEELRGGAAGLRRRPYFVVYNEPVSPLQHPLGSLEKLVLCAETGVPSIYSPAPLAGATAPITVAGHVCQGVAESLFGLVIHQLVRPGAPFIFGIGPAVLDMVTAQSSYNAVEYLQAYLAMLDMAKWLGLPNWGYAGTSDSQVFDAQAGLEISQLTFLSMQQGSNLNHDVGYLDFGLTSSLEQIVTVDEFVGMNRRLLGGIEVSRETLGLDAVAEVGPGGHFLAHAHTHRHVREQFRPTLLNRYSRRKWEEQGGLDLRERARRKALALLAAHQAKPLPENVAVKLEQALAAFTQALG